jgi:hypothetical protein
MDTSDTPMFARSFGGQKRSSKIEARVTDELKFALQKRCHELIMTESDYLDCLVTLAIFGVEHVRNIEQKRLEMVSGLSGIVQK